MDLDGDGALDVLSGSYRPGDLFLFRGNGRGSFEKGAVLKDARGENVSAGSRFSRGEDDLEGLAASPFAADLDGDGDLDLLIGNILGAVVLIRNDGTPTRAAFSHEKKKVEADGVPIKTAGDAGPIAVDWDGDGKLDLLVGDSEGSVWLFRNVGEKTRPEFAVGTELVEASKHRRRKLMADDPIEEQGLRAKVCATDYDGDGRLDLLVGDFLMAFQPEPVLTSEQLAQRDDLRRQRAELNKRLDELNKQGLDEDDPSYQVLNKRRSEVVDALAPLETRRQMHGFVWFFRRKAEEIHAGAR